MDPVGACVKLKWLNISKNKITSLQSLSSLESLEVLNAAQNCLEGKVGVGRLRSLKALVLNGNKIDKVGGLEKLAVLETLILSQNNITSLGGWLAAASSVQKLSMSHNPLESVGDPCPLDALKKLVHMKELRLNHCHLKRIPAQLAAMQRLKILEVGSNDISKEEDLEPLAHLRSLWQLNLKGCPITQHSRYHDMISGHVPHIEVLDTKRIRPKHAARLEGKWSLPAQGLVKPREEIELRAQTPPAAPASQEVHDATDDDAIPTDAFIVKKDKKQKVVKPAEKIRKSKGTGLVKVEKKHKEKSKQKKQKASGNNGPVEKDQKQTKKAKGAAAVAAVISAEGTKLSGWE